MLFDFISTFLPNFHVFLRFLMVCLDFVGFFFRKRSGNIFWVRQFVDVSDGILLVWCSIDFVYVLNLFRGKLCKLMNSYISPIYPKEGNTFTIIQSITVGTRIVVCSEDKKSLRRQMLPRMTNMASDGKHSIG